MNISREFLQELGCRDVAPEITEQLTHAYETATSFRSSAAIADINKQWAGQVMHVVGLDMPDRSAPAIFEMTYERNPWHERAASWVEQARIRRLRAKLDGRAPGYSDIKIEAYRHARDRAGKIIPIARVDQFTATLKRLPEVFMFNAIFEKDVVQSRRYTIVTAELFDRETNRPLVEMYDLGVNPPVL